jgi:hypothetical protein
MKSIDLRKKERDGQTGIKLDKKELDEIIYNY